MKAKDVEKKFKLNKTSIARLNKEDLSQLRGGELCPPPSMVNPIYCLTGSCFILPKPGDTSG